MFRKHKKGNGDWVPDAPAHGLLEKPVETPEVQMKMIRTHIAGASGQISSLNTKLIVMESKINRILEVLGERTEEGLGGGPGQAGHGGDPAGPFPA